MPKLKNRVPSYRLHKRSGLAVVTLDGKDHYLGQYGTPESREEYNRLIAQWLTHHRRRSSAQTSQGRKGDDITVSELLVAYWRFAETYYVKNGKKTDEQRAIKYTMKPLQNCMVRHLLATSAPEP